MTQIVKCPSCGQDKWKYVGDDLDHEPPCGPCVIAARDRNPPAADTNSTSPCPACGEVGDDCGGCWIVDDDAAANASRQDAREVER